MEIKRFNVCEREFSSFVDHYPNFLGQFQDITRLIAPGSALIFLQRGNGYFPAVVTQSASGIYQVEQVPGYHGVGNHKTGDSFSDLEGVLEHGFIEQSEAYNVVVTPVPLATSGSPWWMYARESALEATQGDQYCLEMYQNENVVRKDFPEPGYFTTTYMRWEKVLPENIVTCVKISPNLDIRGKEKRQEFYQERLKGHEFKLV